MDKLAFDMANKFYDVTVETYKSDHKKVGLTGTTFKSDMVTIGVMAATVIFALPALVFLGVALVNMVQRYKECKKILADHPELRDKPLDQMTVRDVVEGGLTPDHVTTFKFLSSTEKNNPSRHELEAERAEQHAIEAATVRRHQRVTVQ